MRFLNFETIEKFYLQALCKAGVNKEDSAIITDVLLKADQLGIDSHGLNRLKSIYLDRIKEGVVFPNTEIEIIKESPTTAVIDAHNGMGHVAGKKAMDICISKAKDYGMGMVVVRNSSHFGIAGYYGLMAAEAGMISLCGTNARPSTAPTFGVENMLGTNPLTFVIPCDEDFPFFLDCATSTSQRAKFEQYAKEGKLLPKGWVIDENGNSETDPLKVLDDLVKGHVALTPVGGTGEETAGYKGYGYATVVEILSSALQSGSYMKMLMGFDELGNKTPYRIGHFFITINIEAFIELDKFKKITGNILRSLRNSKKMPGKDRIFTAGEKEYTCLVERKANGVPINDNLWEELKQITVDYKLTDFYSIFNI